MRAGFPADCCSPDRFARKPPVLAPDLSPLVRFMLILQCTDEYEQSHSRAAVMRTPLMHITKQLQEYLRQQTCGHHTGGTDEAMGHEQPHFKVSPCFRLRSCFL